LESVVTLPLVGPGRTRGWGGYRAPWVTFSFGPSETGLGYILKWLDTRATLGALNLRPEPREVLEERTTCHRIVFAAAILIADQETRL